MNAYVDRVEIQPDARVSISAPFEYLDRAVIRDVVAND
jgi:hypothetical protein